MNEKKIRELFDLCVRVSNETTKHVSFDYNAKNDESALFLYVFNDNGEIEKHFVIPQCYESKFVIGHYENAKKYFLELLINGRCPLNES